jgi:hypothetical protein
MNKVCPLVKTCTKKLATESLQRIIDYLFNIQLVFRDTNMLRLIQWDSTTLTYETAFVSSIFFSAYANEQAWARICYFRNSFSMFCSGLSTFALLLILGPDLPAEVFGARPMAQHPDGGFLVFSWDRILHLRDAQAPSWIPLPQTVKVPRPWATVFLVPDEIVRCV